MLKAVLAALALSAAAVTGASAAAVTAPVVQEAHLTIDSPIKDLLADPAAAAVLDKHLPELKNHPMLPQFQDNSLPQVAPMSQGRITPEIIAAITEELAALHEHAH